MQEFLQTPKKNSGSGLLQTNEKSNEFVDKLKEKIIQITKQHEKELIEKRQQIEFYATKMDKVEFLENEIESYQVRLESTRAAVEQFEDISKKYSELKVQLMEKNEAV